MRVAVEADCLAFGDLRISFQRTLRIPDDGRAYPLPPGLGMFPIVRAVDCLHRLPEHRVADDDFLSLCISAKRCGWGSTTTGHLDNLT